MNGLLEVRVLAEIRIERIGVVLVGHAVHGQDGDSRSHLSGRCCCCGHFL